MVEQLAGIVDDRLAMSGSRPGMDGREIVVLLEALGTGLLMHAMLDPGVIRPELASLAVRKLLADTADRDGAGQAEAGGGETQDAG
jgi:hypothetical protein